MNREQIDSLYDLSKKIIRDDGGRNKARCFAIIYTFLIWILIILGILAQKLDRLNYISFFFSGFSYLIYLISEFQTPNTKFILSKSKKNLYENINSFFKEKPILLFKWESYHEVSRKERTEKVVTHTENKFLIIIQVVILVDLLFSTQNLIKINIILN